MVGIMVVGDPMQATISMRRLGVRSRAFPSVWFLDFQLQSGCVSIRYAVVSVGRQVTILPLWRLPAYFSSGDNTEEFSNNLHTLVLLNRSSGNGFSTS